jgi:hypothetical protein
MPDKPRSDLQQVGHIADLLDGYRLCIAIACTYGMVPNVERTGEKRTTMFAANTLDTPDLALRTAISEIYPDVRDTPYRAAEDLAEQGVAVLRDLLQGEDLRFTDLIQSVEELGTAQSTSADDA